MAKLSLTSIIPFVFLFGLPLVQAADKVIFKNHCSYDFYFWEVGHGLDPLDSEYTVVKAGKTLSRPLIDVKEGAIAVKINSEPHFRLQPAPVLQVEYNLESDQVWYDLSAVDCLWSRDMVLPDKAKWDEEMRCPFVKDGGVALYLSDSKCAQVPCSEKECPNAYHKEGSFPDEPTFHCSSGTDIHFDTCKSTIDDSFLESSHTTTSQASKTSQTSKASQASKSSQTSKAKTLQTSKSSLSPVIGPTLKPWLPPPRRSSEWLLPPRRSSEPLAVDHNEIW